MTITDEMIDAGLYELDEVFNPTYTKQYRRACVHHAIKTALAAAPTPPPAEPAPELPNTLIGARNVNNRLAMLEQQVQALTAWVNEQKADQRMMDQQLRDMGIVLDDPAPEQSAADDAGKWEFVAQAIYETDPRTTKQWIDGSRAAVAEAVKQGLVARVDPADPEQQKAINDAVESWSGRGGKNEWAAHLLTALAASLDGSEA